MIRYTLRTVFKNKLLWAWPGIVLLLVASLITWGDISTAQNSYSFIIGLGSLQMPSGMFISQFLMGLISLIAIITIPSHLSENLEPKRAALLLSKPISRTQLFFADFAGVTISTIILTGITVCLLAILTVVKAALFPYQLFLGLLIFIPLIIFSYYITISLFLVLTNSYLGSVLLGFFFTGFSRLFLNTDKFLATLGWEHTFADVLISVLSYLIPSAGGFERLMEGVLMGGFSTIDGSLLLFSLATCLPFGLLSLYFFRKKEF